MTDFLEFDPAAAYRLTHDRLPALSWFALSARSVDDFIDAGYATGSANGPRSLALGFGEITGTGYGRQSQSTPAGVGETTTFSQLTWDTGTATDWRSPKSLVLCTSANNKGYAIAAWNLTPGGAATDLSSAHSTVSITPVVSPPSSGGSGSPGSPIVRKFPFAFDTPNLHTGAALYTPTVGDILLNAWLEIDTAWNGTSPLGDVGADLPSGDAWFVNTTGFYVDMALADRSDISPALDLLSGGSTPNGTPNNVDLAQGLIDQYLSRIGDVGFSNMSFQRGWPAKFIAADPIKVCVANGGPGGADPGSTRGAAALYLVTATPV